MCVRECVCVCGLARRCEWVATSVNARAHTHTHHRGHFYVTRCPRKSIPSPSPVILQMLQRGLCSMDIVTLLRLLRKRFCTFNRIVLLMRSCLFRLWSHSHSIASNAVIRRNIELKSNGRTIDAMPDRAKEWTTTKQQASPIYSFKNLKGTLLLVDVPNGSLKDQLYDY